MIASAPTIDKYAEDAFLRYSILLGVTIFLLAVVMLSIVPVNRVALGTRAGSSAAEAVRHAARVHLAVHIGVFGALSASLMDCGGAVFNLTTVGIDE